MKALLSILASCAIFVSMGTSAYAQTPPELKTQDEPNPDSSTIVELTDFQFKSNEAIADALHLSREEMEDGYFRTKDFEVSMATNGMQQISITRKSKYEIYGISVGQDINAAIHQLRYIAHEESRSAPDQYNEYGHVTLRGFTSSDVATVGTDELFLFAYDTKTNKIVQFTVMYENAEYNYDESSSADTANSSNAAASVEMFYGYWDFKADYRQRGEYVDTLTYSAYDIILNDEYIYEAVSEDTAIAKYPYTVLSMEKDNPDFYDTLGSGYYLHLELTFDSGSTMEQLLFMKEAHSDTVYQLDINDDGSLENINPPRFVNKEIRDAGKPAVTYKVGDQVKTGGYLDFFIGTVTAVDGDDILVYWSDLVDLVWGSSVWQNYSSNEMRMSEMISGAELFSSTWHKGDKLSPL